VSGEVPLATVSAPLGAPIRRDASGLQQLAAPSPAAFDARDFMAALDPRQIAVTFDR